MKRNPLTGTEQPKSARYQFNWELPDPQGVRINNGRIPGGTNTGIVPSPEQVAMNAGKKKMKGGLVVLNRGETYDTDDEANKKLTGAGIFSTIENIANSVAPLLALGKSSLQKGGRKPMTNVLTKAKQAKQLKLNKKLKGGMEMTPYTEAPLQEVSGAGIMGDIGSGLDALGSILGLGKTKSKKMKGGAIDDVKQQLDELEGGVKNLKKLMKKL